MIKRFFIATFLITLSSSALAIAQEKFYLKAELGVDKLNKIKDEKSRFKLNPKSQPFFGVGIGCYILQNTRADIMFDHYNKLSFNKSVSVNNQDNTLRQKTTINSLLLNSYIDLADISIVKVFGGVGVGLAQVRESASGQEVTKIQNRTNSILTINGQTIRGTVVTNEERVNKYAYSKKFNNLAYAFILGVSSELTDSIKGEIAYSWRDFGKTEVDIIDTNGAKTHKKTFYKGHHIAAGVRFSL